MLDEAYDALRASCLDEVLVVLQQLSRRLCDQDVQALFDRIQCDRIVRACRSCLNRLSTACSEPCVLSGVKTITASPGFLSSIAFLSMSILSVSNDAAARALTSLGVDFVVVRVRLETGKHSVKRLFRESDVSHTRRLDPYKRRRFFLADAS